MFDSQAPSEKKKRSKRRKKQEEQLYRLTSSLSAIPALHSESELSVSHYCMHKKQWRRARGGNCPPFLLTWWMNLFIINFVQGCDYVGHMIATVQATCKLAILCLFMPSQLPAMMSTLDRY